MRRTDQTLAGKFYRFRKMISKYLAGTTLGAGIMGVVYMIYDFLKVAASSSRIVARHGYKVAGVVGKAVINSSKTTKAAIIGASSYIYARSYEKGVGGAISDIAEKTGQFVSAGIDAFSSIIKISADAARFVANNTTISVFVAIITIIGIIYSTDFLRK